MLTNFFKTLAYFRPRNIKATIRFPGRQGLTAAWELKHSHFSPKDYYLIACMPKSGSTFLANVLCELTGYQYVGLTYAYERNDQNLYLPKLMDAFHFGSVTHQHLRATGPNIELLNRFSIRPVILTRNLFDVVISIRDHMFNEGYPFPTFYCNEQFNELGIETQYDMIIEQGLPWYFNFYVSWTEAVSSGAIDALWLSYEKMTGNWNASLRKITDFYGFQASDEDIETALQRTRNKRSKKTRFNKGVSGRGLSQLSDKQKNTIISQARFYPHIDFGPLGINASRRVDEKYAQHG